MLRADPEPIGADDLGDFRDRPGGFETEIAYDHVSFVDQNARAFLQLREADARIDIAIIIRAADDDVGRIPGRIVEISADAIGGRSHLLDHFLELLDHLARFADCFLLRLDLRAQDVELAPMPVLRRNRGDQKIERFEQTQLVLARTILRVLELLCCVCRSCERLFDYKPGAPCRKLAGT